ncbi:MAG: hypothetical protein AAF627_12180 [Myxococcota bacterium]
MKRLFSLALLSSVILPVFAQAQSESEVEQSEGRKGSRADRVLATADQGIARDFVIWSDEKLDGFIKPIIQLSSSVVGYLPEADVQNREFDERVSTLLLSRIGFEGELFGFLSFRTLFERNVGFNLARNGPVGTSIWEGTASWQARENYIRLSKWGLELSAGILPDPASVDYISKNILDTFGMDPYVRDPLLVSGFNQGQSVLFRAKLGELTGWSPIEGLIAGVSFTGGNPLVSSLSFGFGGQVRQTVTLFSAPLRALSNGLPGSDIHMSVVTPSLTYDSRWFAAKAAGQLYWVDNDVTQSEDATLTGHNLRATVQLEKVSQYVFPFLLLFDLKDDFLKLYGTAAYRENDTVALPDITMTREERFVGILAAGGFDIDLSGFDIPVIRNFGLGGNYYYIDQQFSAEAADGRPDDRVLQYINLGLTYWLWQDVASAGFRWARNQEESTQETTRPTILDATDSFILSLRLLI